MAAEISFHTIHVSEIGHEYWRRTSEGHLPLMQCESCGKHRRYLTRVCPECFSTSHRWVEASGKGRIYAFTEIHYAPTAEFTAPYVLALVDLEEGVRMMTNILDARGADLRIGMPVRVTFQKLPDGKMLPQMVVDTARA